MVEDGTSFGQSVAEQRAYLLRFARIQVRNAALAEDVVSEAVLAALSRPQAFHGSSSLRTWLVGILKHKILDLFRRHHREMTQGWDDANECVDLLDLISFEHDGHFAVPPSDWGNPEQNLCNQQFMRVLETCLERLPPVQARVFLMREWLEMPCEDVCAHLAITPGNLYVLLHRARLRLRECLELSWFGSNVSPRSTHGVA